MKTQNAKTQLAMSVLVALAALNCAARTTVKHDISITSDPPGAEVYIDELAVGQTPYATNKLKYDKELHVRVVLDNFVSDPLLFSSKEVDTYTKDRKVPWTITFKLDRIHLDVPITVNAGVDGAMVYTNEQKAGSAPWTGRLEFNRARGGSFGTYTIGVYKSNYKAWASEPITESQAEDKGAKGIELTATLDEIRRDIPFEFRANMPDAMVYVNDVPSGSPPLHTNLTFMRGDATQDWSVNRVRISKEGCEYSPLGKEPAPDFVTNLTVNSGPLVDAQDFVAVKFVLAPLRKFELAGDKIKVNPTNSLAEVTQTDLSGLTAVPFGRMKPEDGYVLSRISAWPGQPDKIVYAKLTRDERGGVGVGREHITGSHICINDDGAQSVVPGGDYYDIDPFVTDKFIYFSSDHDGSRAIWRMGIDGRLPQRITVTPNTVDTEPAVSMVAGKLAYTSRPVGAPAGEPSQINTADLNGTLPGPIQQGSSPTWSPDGQTIAYITPTHKLHLMDARGGADRVLDERDANDEYPVYTHSGNSIVFASDFGRDNRNRRNWDIWIVRADDSKAPTQVTQNGSLDSCPAISSDGRYLYFFSNRGAQKTGQESLQIFRLVLPDPNE